MNSIDVFQAMRKGSMGVSSEWGFIKEGMEALDVLDTYDEIYNIASEILKGGCYELDEDTELDQKSLEDETLYSLLDAFRKMSSWKSKLKLAGISIDIHYYALTGYNSENDEAPDRVFALSNVYSERKVGVSIYLPKLPDVISLTTTSEFWSDVANFDLVDVSNMSTSMYSITGLSELLQSVIINKQVSIPLSIAERIKYNKDNLMQMVKNYMLIDFEDVNNLIDMYDNDKHYEVPVIPFGDVLSKFFEYKKISEIEQYILGLGKGLKPEERRKLVSMNALSYSSANTYLNIGEYFQCVDITEPEEKPRNADYITYVKLCEDLNTYYESDNKTREAELDTTAVSCESLIHETLTNIVSICTKQDLISSKDGKPEQLDMSIPEGFAEVYMDNDSTVKLLKEEMEKLFEAVRNVDYSDYGCCDDKDEEWERDHHFSDWEDNTIYNSSGDIWHNRVADEIDSLDEDDEWLDDEDSYYDDKYSYDYSNDEEYSYEY